MCGLLLLAAAPFLTGRHAPWLAAAHWLSALTIGKSLFDSSSSMMGVDRFTVMAATSQHLLPALAYTTISFINAIRNEDIMAMLPWKTICERCRMHGNFIFAGIGTLYLLWALSWMIFPSYTVQSALSYRIPKSSLPYVAHTEYSVS
jgi:hypothetical protein